MTDLRLRPRTVSELVDAGFALYRRNALQYIVISSLAIAPLLVLQLAEPGALRPTATNLSGMFLVIQLASVLTYALMSAAVVKLGSMIYLGGEPDVAAAVREVLPRVPSLLLAGLLLLPLFALGFLVFIVGALYVTARFFAVSTVVILEGKSATAAFGRSSELSKGRKRHILNTLGLVFLIYLVLSMGVGGLAALTQSTVLQLVISTVYTIVAYPVFALVQMLLYYDTRIRGEGFDLEQMTSALGAPAVTAP